MEPVPSTDNAYLETFAVIRDTHYAILDNVEKLLAVEKDCPITEGAKDFIWRVFVVACGIVNELEFLHLDGTPAEIEETKASLQRNLKTFSHFLHNFYYVPIGSKIEAYVSSDRIIQKEAMEDGRTKVNMCHLYSGTDSSKTFYLSPEPTSQELVELLDKMLAFTFVCPKMLLSAL